MGKFRFGKLVTSVVLIAASLAVIYFRQDIYDWWQLRSYKPPAEVQSIAEKSKLTETGKRIFYLGAPAIEDRDNFNRHCGKKGEKTIVLGCYDGRNIYIYNVTEPKLAGVKEVTSMHEMLHAAYDRLSKDERMKVDALLEQQQSKLTDNRLLELIAEYRRTEPSEVMNELHSILGTELETLIPDLEEYYKKYFNDRQATVAFARQYETAFTQNRQQIDELDAQLTALKTQIEAQEAALQQQQAALEAENARIEQLKSQPDQYNAAVGPYNQQVRAYNAALATTKEMINQFNAKVEQRNQLAAVYNDLAKSLDSNFQPLPAE